MRDKKDGCFDSDYSIESLLTRLLFWVHLVCSCSFYSWGPECFKFPRYYFFDFLYMTEERSCCRGTRSASLAFNNFLNVVLLETPYITMERSRLSFRVIHTQNINDIFYHYEKSINFVLKMCSCFSSFFTWHRSIRRQADAQSSYYET